MHDPYESCEDIAAKTFDAEPLEDHIIDIYKHDAERAGDFVAEVCCFGEQEAWNVRAQILVRLWIEGDKLALGEFLSGLMDQRMESIVADWEDYQ